MTTRTYVAAAAPLWVRERLAGPMRDVTVVHAGRHAVYVAVADDVAPRCIGLLSRSSSMVPCGLRTTLTDLSALTGANGPLAAGDVVSAGAGILSIGSVDVGIGRTVDLSAPRLDPFAAGTMATRLRGMVAGRLAAAQSELPSVALTSLGQGDPAVVPMLLGRGSGLTPVGDDVLAGWLATTKAAQSESGPMASEVARLSANATTLLSATLLDRASAGDVLPEFGRLLLDLRMPFAGRLGDDVELMLAIGHTSGAGLLLGSLLAFDHLTHNHPIARSQ